MKNFIYLFVTVLLFSCTNQERKIPENFDFGKTENGTYQNNFFDLKLSFNPDWDVQNKEEMDDILQQGAEIVAGEDEELKNAIKASEVTTAYLLTVFRDELGTTLEFNPSFMILAENTKNVKAIKNGKDYLNNTKTVLKRTQMPYTFEKEIVEKKIGESKFYIMEANLSNGGYEVTQEYMTTLINGFCLSFIISYSSEEEKAELHKVLDSIRM